MKAACTALKFLRFRGVIHVVTPTTRPWRTSVRLRNCGLTALTTRFVTLDRFGESGPYKALAEKFGFTAENVLAKAREIV